MLVSYRAFFGWCVIFTLGCLTGDLTCWGASQVISREEALAAVFPGAEIRAERVFLTPEQREKVAELAGAEMETALLARYLASQEGREVGRAYVDTHVVRTKKESLLICLDAQGQIKRVEVTAFLEPLEYLPSEAWYQQFQGKVLGEELNLHRAIRPIAGATLTARSTSQAVRRALAVDQILRAAGQ